MNKATFYWLVVELGGILIYGSVFLSRRKGELVIFPKNNNALIGIPLWLILDYLRPYKNYIFQKDCSHTYCQGCGAGTRASNFNNVGAGARYFKKLWVWVKASIIASGSVPVL